MGYIWVCKIVYDTPEKSDGKHCYEWQSKASELNFWNFFNVLRQHPASSEKRSEIQQCCCETSHLVGSFQCEWDANRWGSHIVLSRWDFSTIRATGIIRTNQGQAVLSAAWRRAVTSVGLIPKVTAAYSPQSKRQGEQMTQTLGGVVRRMLPDTQDDWGEPFSSNHKHDPSKRRKGLIQLAWANIWGLTTARNDAKSAVVQIRDRNS